MAGFMQILGESMGVTARSQLQAQFICPQPFERLSQPGDFARSFLNLAKKEFRIPQDVSRPAEGGRTCCSSRGTPLYCQIGLC